VCKGDLTSKGQLQVKVGLSDKKSDLQAPEVGLSDKKSDSNE